MASWNSSDLSASRLTFSSPLPPNNLHDLLQLRPVRKAVTRSKRGVKAKVADTSTGRSLHAESKAEFLALRVLLAIANAEWKLEQPFHLEYHDGGRKCRYTPDVGLSLAGDLEAVEIKEDEEAQLPENQSRFALIREHLSRHGFRFRVWPLSEICAEPRFANASMILRYRNVTVSAAEHEFIRRRFSSHPELTLRAIGDSSPEMIQVVFRLILDGVLHIDWWMPLSLDSKISVVPIGKQLWPSRYTSQDQSNREQTFR